MLKEAQKITIFCGAGVSCSLSGSNVTWYSWLERGLEFIDDELKTQVKENLATGNLLDVAGEIVQYTKANHQYEKWMNTSFSDLTIGDTSFAECFSRLHHLGDVIATTNYDMLLEKATTTETLTYNQPDKILDVIRQDDAPQIIHIHGAYNHAEGIDDIIADNSQYDQIIGNSGAQFLQSLLGINPIIFVGCGQTMDDPNIGKLITFAKDHLNIDVPYFYLCKSDDDISELGNHMKPVIYGNSYSDLPLFFTEIVNYRLQQKFKDSNIIELTPYSLPPLTEGGLDLYYFANHRSIPFAGREEELKQLQDFINSSGDCKWWAVTGVAGMGKSRLAFEVLKQLLTGWFGFFIKENASIDDIDAFQPFNNTVVVVDNARSPLSANIITALMNVFDKSKFKLRIILLERDNIIQFGGWYSEMIYKMSNHEKMTFRGNAYRLPEEVQFGRKPKPSKAFLNLSSPDETATISIISDFCRLLGDDVDRDKSKLIYHSYLKNIPENCHRPLFLQIFIEIWLDKQGDIEPMIKEELFSNLILKEEDRWRELMSQNQKALNDLTKLISLACAVNHIDLHDLPETYKSHWGNIQQVLSLKSGEQGRQRLAVILRELSQQKSLAPNVISPQYLDVIKAFIVHFYQDEEEYISFAEKAWNYGPDGFLPFTLFLSKALEDFPEYGSFQEMICYLPEDNYHYFYLFVLLSQMPYIRDLNQIENNLAKISMNDELVAANLIETWYRLGYVYTTKGDYLKLEKCADQIINLCDKGLAYETTKNRKHGILLCVEHLHQFANAFFNNQRYDAAERCIDYLVKLQETEMFRNDDGLSTEIVEAQKAAFIAYMKKDYWKFALSKLKAIQQVHFKFPEDKDNAEIYAHCLRQTCFHLGKDEKAWKDLDIWVRELEKIHRAFPGSSEIVGDYALTLSNRMTHRQFSVKEKVKKKNINDLGKIERLYNRHEEVGKVATALASVYRDKVNQVLEKGKNVKAVSKYMIFFKKACSNHPDEGGIQSCYLVAYYLAHFEYDTQTPTDEDLNMFYQAAVKFNEYDELPGFYARLISIREQHSLRSNDKVGLAFARRQKARLLKEFPHDPVVHLLQGDT